MFESSDSLQSLDSSTKAVCVERARVLKQHLCSLQVVSAAVTVPPVEVGILERAEAEAVAMEPAAQERASQPFADVIVSFTLKAATGAALHTGGVGQGMATAVWHYRVHACGTVNVGCQLAVSKQLPPLPPFSG